jgi:phosphoglycolate phosphatase
MIDLRLIIFDVDGTLVDSQSDIVGAMNAAFLACGLPIPARADVLGIVGLSLHEAVRKIVPEQPESVIDRAVQAYKDAYMDMRKQIGAAQSSPLYPHAREVLDVLSEIPENVLSIATGKSRRGLDVLIDAHKLQGLFVSPQVADHHPSKPHPAMIQTILSETGIDVNRAVMIGDTTYDMEMAAAAGVKSIGVSWGYHAVELLKADVIVQNFTDIPAAIDMILGKH